VKRNAWFAAWALVGCAFALGAVSLGVLAVGPAALAAFALSRSRPARESAFGALAGIGLLLLFVAYLNREGPGTTCWEHGRTMGCDEHLNPLPWLALGLAFVAGGFLAHRLRHR
jgi:hypothetical protein